MNEIETVKAETLPIPLTRPEICKRWRARKRGETVEERLRGAKAGALNHRWHGGKTRGGTKGKYVHIYMPDHPRAHHGHVAEHILIAERVLGKPLPLLAVVHHSNRDESDNKNANLVICENQAYHRFLHGRMQRKERMNGINTN